MRGLRAQLLAQQGDAVVGVDQRVERVAALPGRGRRVRVAPAELDHAGVDRQHRRRDHVGHAGMDHHRRADVLEGAGLDQLDLAAAALLGRRAEHAHGAGDAVLLQRRRDAEPGRDAGGGDQVVPAGVADQRQRVVLAEHRDGGPAAVAAWRGHGFERGLDPVGRAGDPPAGAFEEGGQRGVRVPFLVVLLRVRVDVEAERAQRRGGCGDRGGCGLLRRGHRRALPITR